jgi:hypothetical protein
MRTAQVLLMAALAVAGRHPLQAQADTTRPTLAWTTVTYLSGGTVYLEVGRRHGVTDGTTFTVVRGGVGVAELAANFVSSNRTASRVVSGTVPLVIGDSVRYAPVPVVESVPIVAAGAPGTTRAPVRRPAPVHGRVGLRYLVLDHGTGRVMRQPSLDLRIDGAQIGGTPLGLAIDVRMQRTSVSGGSGGTQPSGRTRVYQAAVQHQRQRNGSRIALGRQFATALSPLGIFDGLALDLQGEGWSGGALVGTQPDASTFAPSVHTVEYGLWVQRHSARGTQSQWSVTLGGIGAYDQGEIDREFLYLRGTWSSRLLSLYAAQEIDVNRGWKREAEGGLATFTSSFVSAHLTLADAVQLSGGLDSRRSVRLYRDFVDPEIAFDDAHRQGRWGEVTLRGGRHLRASAGLRSSSDGESSGSRSATASLVASDLTDLGLGFRARMTQYRGPLSEGQLSSVSLEAAPSHAFRVSLNAGVRTSAAPIPDADTRLTWLGGDIDMAIGRRLYLLLSTYREVGPLSTSVQGYGSLTWRF